MKPVAAVFLPWWGPAPSWHAHFLARAAEVRSLVPVLVGDAGAWDAPGYVERVPCTMDEFEARASETAGVLVQKRDPRYPRGQALCELRPLLAAMYPDVIAAYPWWGYGDWDVVWGDWDSFLVGAVLTYFDIITTNPRIINGPLTLFRNAPLTHTLYRDRMDAVRDQLANAYLDEVGMTALVVERVVRGDVRVLYPGGLNGHDRMVPGCIHCAVIDGKLYRLDARGHTIGHDLLKFHFPGRKQWPVIPAANHEAFVPVAHHSV